MREHYPRSDMATTMHVTWNRIRRETARGRQSTIADVSFSPMLKLEGGITQRPTPVECDGQRVGFIAVGSTDLVLYQDFPFDYLQTLTEAEMVGECLVVRAPDDLRNVVRKLRRGV